MSQNLILWYVGAVIFGGVIALVTVGIFRRFAPAGSTRQYWTIVGKDIHGLLYGDEDIFWAHYVNIIRQTAKYVGRQLLALVLAFAPLVVAFYVIGPWIFAQWDRGAEIAVVPEHAGIITSAASRSESGEIDQHTLTLPDGADISIPGDAGSVVVCEPRQFGCFVLQGFGFTAVTVDSTGSPELDLIVVRSAHNDWNPLWPYLSDPEFLFFLSLSLGSIVFFAQKKKGVESKPQDYAINLVDYVLTLLATRNMRFMRKLGDLETRLYAKRLAANPIEKPVFIAGLARSGTTILLEKLSAGTSFATHRYRDFPFVMTPIIWNRFLRLFGTEQTPSERPHQDKIKITRDSPDAFEEPIWQYYFPHLHESARRHILDAATKNDEFAAFYHEHVQKILLLRKGARYLSKGNYNLSRIEYIASMYPDAVFLVPIRHPFTHVESLIRQHELFTKYAETDPKIPNYLRAVGHYEFGPQRVPIHMTDSGAEEIKAAWANGDDLLGYAMQWRDVYNYVIDLFAGNPQLAERIQLVRFEDLCQEPVAQFARVLDHIDIGSELTADQLAIGIQASAHRCGITAELREQCWQIVESVARSYGYSKSLEKISEFSGISTRK